MGEAVGAPPPQLDAYLYGVVAAYGRLGRDANGGLLYSERRLWLESNLADAGEREAWDAWFDAMEGENREIRREEREEIEAEARGEA